MTPEEKKMNNALKRMGVSSDDVKTAEYLIRESQLTSESFKHEKVIIFPPLVQYPGGKKSNNN